ncbi:MAG: hypothetical protein AABW68_01380, partial [archaeon]
SKSLRNRWVSLSKKLIADPAIRGGEKVDCSTFPSLSRFSLFTPASARDDKNHSFIHANIFP